MIDEVAQDRLELAPGDVLILASDGLATLGGKDVAAICDDAGDDRGPEGIANMLIRRIYALALKRQDNATVVVVRQSSAG